MKRLAEISSNKTCFNQEKRYFQDALKEERHTHTLQYGHKGKRRFNRPFIGSNTNEQGNENSENTGNPAKKGRNIICFTHPFHLYCANNVGQEFRKLLNKHFTRNNDLSKLFNRNKLEITYS